MAAPTFELKSYQRASLAAVRTWLTDAADSCDPGAAFYRQTHRAYQPVQGLPGVPYACLRLPTGGGKTVIAAHLVGVAADALLKVDNPCALWLVPSNAIREQTLKALKNRAHPFRQALAERFGENLRVLTASEALYAKRPDYDGGSVVIVATIQAFRVEATEGRKVYDASGELLDHFSGLPDVVVKRLELTPGGNTPIPSLCNVLKLRRPVVIVDEAHNARTNLSFTTLARFDPSAILELTATPAKDSNVLYHVSAAELKAADMIKLPIVLRGRPDWKDTVSDAKAWLETLTEKARLEESATGERVRPVMLLQAQPDKGPAAITVEVLKRALTEDFMVPPSQIAIATGKIWELDGVDLAARDCPVRFVITVQALKEGWDCPNAYVLCSVAEQHGATAVEQILGRVMRLPNARRKRDPDLNQAYAFAATISFKSTADALADGLIANGFEKLEAKELVRAGAPLFDLAEDGATFESAPLPDDIDLGPLAVTVTAATGGRMRVDPETRRIVATGAVTAADAAAVRLAVPNHAAAAVAGLVARAATAVAQPTTSMKFAVPGLAVVRAGKLELFGREHFLDLPWRLDECDAAAILGVFSEPLNMGQQATLDVSAEGKVKVFMQDLHDQLSLSLGDRGWDYPLLVRWLDRRLAPTTRQRDVTQQSAQRFIRAALQTLESEGGLEFERLARWRFRLVDSLARLIQTYRDERERTAFEACLFGNTLLFKTSQDFATVFDTELYWPPTRYQGRYLRSFHKHLKPGVIGMLNGEEEACALAIDSHRLVKIWVRNLERFPSSFRLQTSSDYFYPDFVAELIDGRSLVVEYKGGHLVSGADTAEKEWVGEKWARASAGRCVFVMMKDRDFAAIDRALA
jgi:type III restriction enzyme